MSVREAKTLILLCDQHDQCKTLLAKIDNGVLSISKRKDRQQHIVRVRLDLLQRLCVDLHSTT